MASNKPEVIIRLGSHAEKEYVTKLSRFLDGLIVGANLFESTPGATASLLLTTEAKKIYIDPMTYAFGAYHDPETGEVRTDLDWIKSDQIRKKNEKKQLVRDFKKSYKKLAEELGPPISAALSSGKAVSASQLEDRGAQLALCKSVANYQLNRIQREFEGDEELKSFAENAPRPAAVFAPYFYVEPRRQSSLMQVNVALMEAAATLDIGVPIHGIVCADVSHITDDEFVEQLINVAKRTKISGIWLWFSRFFEDKAEEAVLEKYRDLVASLAKHVDVYALHGGYFSLALWSFGMQGVSHGVGYGEQKDVLPIIGQSTPTVRYYLPAAAKRLGVPDIELALKALKITSPEDFHREVCSCAVCKGIVRKSIDEFSSFGDMHLSHPEAERMAQTPAAAKRCRFHFLLSRIRERDEMSKMSAKEVSAKLTSNAEKWGSQRSLKSNCEHLQRWNETLT